MIDIKVRNTSETTAFLKRLTFKVNAVKTARNRSKYSTYPVSWVYNILLDPHSTQDEKSLDLSQVVRPNDVDRFVVVVGHTHGYGELLHAVYSATIILHYNENQFIEMGTFNIKVTAPVYFRPAGPSNIVQIPTEIG